MIIFTYRSSVFPFCRSPKTMAVPVLNFVPPSDIVRYKMSFEYICGRIGKTILMNLYCSEL